MKEDRQAKDEGERGEQMGELKVGEGARKTREIGGRNGLEGGGKRGGCDTCEEEGRQERRV